MLQNLLKFPDSQTEKNADIRQNWNPKPAVTVNAGQERKVKDQYYE